MNILPSCTFAKGLKNKSRMTYLKGKLVSICDYRDVSDKIERDKRILENCNIGL